jgi:hypothetical protein
LFFVEFSIVIRVDIFILKSRLEIECRIPLPRVDHPRSVLFGGIFIGKFLSNLQNLARRLCVNEALCILLLLFRL